VTLSMALWSSMAAMDSSLGLLSSLTPSSIVRQSKNQLMELLWQFEPAPDTRIFNLDIGGGMVGALQYSMLYWLFGYYGAKFVLIIEFAISLLLITNRSYVEMGR